MSLAISLLGRPSITVDGESAYRFRSRKSWALLAYLLLAERAPSRARLAELLFDDAADPLGALRWNLAEVRRALGVGSALHGDPVELALPDDTVVDVLVLVRGSWEQAVGLPGLGSPLLDGVDVRGAAGFESWLVVEQARVSAASESVLHEAAQGLLARGEALEALHCAERAVAMDPWDENNQVLLLSLHRRLDDGRAAQRAFDAYARLLADEFGARPGPAAVAALEEQPRRSTPVTGSVSVEAILESGAAAVAAGATDAGLTSLRTAVALADLADDPALRVHSRIVLAETLVHSLRGRDEEGLASLYAADEIAVEHGSTAGQAQVRAELGYVDFLRARYDRAEKWLTDATALSGHDLPTRAKAATYLASVRSDRADYPSALSLSLEAVALAREAGERRRETYAVTMLGRMHLLRGELDAADEALRSAIELGERERWLAFLPWPQAFVGELELARGRVETASTVLGQAFARACQLGDPCWEGVSARGLALVADARGHTDAAFELLADARARANRLADPYVWLDAYILDALCTLGVRHAHPDAPTWARLLHRLASRTGMRELTVRALLHAASLGDPDAADGARLLATEIDSPALAHLVAP